MAKREDRNTIIQCLHRASVQYCSFATTLFAIMFLAPAIFPMSTRSRILDCNGLTAGNGYGRIVRNKLYLDELYES